MTSLSDRQHCIALIDEAVVSGASLYKACSVIEVHHKTYRRWVSAGAVKADGVADGAAQLAVRPDAIVPSPKGVVATVSNCRFVGRFYLIDALASNQQVTFQLREKPPATGEAVTLALRSDCSPLVAGCRA